MAAEDVKKNGVILADIFDEDEAEKAFLQSKPTCFLIVGKPGTGKATLGRMISNFWKCVFVEAGDLIEERLRSETEDGHKIQELLVQGLSVPDELVVKLIFDKINTAEVKHRGYVLCGIPCFAEDFVTNEEQIMLIKNLNLAPDIIINIKCPDYDLNKRLSGQKQDPETGHLYQREQWDPDILTQKKKKAKKEREEQAEEEEEEEEEEAADEEQDTGIAKEILESLVRRPEDFPENIDARVKLYKDTMLRPLEDLMVDHDPQYRFELDGNRKVDELSKFVQLRLESLGLRPGAVVIRIHGADEEESQNIFDTEELFRTLASTQLIAPRYRWRRSRWGRACPVALKGGNMKMGVTEFSVSFLDKMYILSSEEALKQFVSNPRPFLLPPMPLPTCTVAVFGPPSSGKTTLCNLIADKYKGKVFDIAKLLLPHLEEANEKALKQAQATALESAIETVKVKMTEAKMLKEQVDAELAADGPFEPEGQHPIVEEEEDEDEEKTQNTTEETSEIEVTAYHPEVQALVEEAVKLSMQTPVTLPSEVCAEILEKAIKEFKEENKERFFGAPPIGGWVLDNFPNLPEHWLTISEKGIIPDTVICLKDSEENGKFLLNRLYLQNAEAINASIVRRLEEERDQAAKELVLARKEQQEVLRLQKEEQYKQEHLQVLETVREDDTADVAVDFAVDELHDELRPQREPVELPTIPEGGFPDVPEMESFKHIINLFTQEFQLLEHTISESFSGEIVFLEIAGKSPETLLENIVANMEKPFKYHGWELSAVDMDEEEEDQQAELDTEENEEEEEEESKEEEEDEEAKFEKKKHFGDTKHFCPVALKDKFVLWPGSSEFAAKYREKLYYCSSADAMATFLQKPEQYVTLNEPLKAPPLRVFLLGTRGAGKTTCGRWLAKKLGIFHIQYHERLQEIMLSKLEKKIGPEFEEEPFDDPNNIAALLASESESSSKTELETNKSETKEEEAVLTEDEEAIRLYLSGDEVLPPELLYQIVTPWWTNEPFRSTGVILDDFPRTMEESQFVGDFGLFPDIAILLQVEENDVMDRLLPAHLAKWKERYTKKEDYKQKKKETRKKIRDEHISKRRAELLAQRASKQENKQLKEDTEIHDEAEEEEEEDEDDDTELTLAEEFPEEEEVEEEPEEQEEEASERMKSEIGEKVEAETANIEAVKEELQKLKIPLITINAGRKTHIVEYLLYEKLKHLVENRESLFEKCYPISVALADKMLSLSYKHLSVFGQWDPIKLWGGDAIKTVKTPANPCFPVIYRQCIYFFSTKENRELFMKNPLKYLRQPKPKPYMPMRIAIVGPPKSGKSTVSRKLESVYGLKRLSMGDAIRFVLDVQPQTELALELQKHLYRGLTVPDELAIQCLQVTLMDLAASTVGVVLDGYPVTKRQIDILESQSIIPMKIIELKIHMKEVLTRGLLDKKNSDRSYPLPDSPQILAVRNSCHKLEIKKIKEYYEHQNQNWSAFDSLQSKWWLWDRVIGEIQANIKCIQIYLERIKEGKAACIDNLCITPEELQSRLCEYGQYSPVSLALRGELVDCSETASLRFAAEFRGCYYKMASQDELNTFLETPYLFVPPLALYALPPPNMLPRRLTVAEVKARFPTIAELQGYCPVTFLDGKQRYEALIPGNIENAIDYRDKIFIFESEKKLRKFMKLPEKYWNQKLPNKLPPKKEPILLSYLPISGYLEQGAATALIKALNDVGCLKPKFPFLSVKRSALLYMAYHLKVFNPRQPDYARKKYKKKMDHFLENCELITYLGNKMTQKYKESQNRPIDFDFKLRTFLSLKKCRPDQ